MKTFEKIKPYFPECIPWDIIREVGHYLDHVYAPPVVNILTLDRLPIIINKSSIWELNEDLEYIGLEVPIRIENTEDAMIEVMIDFKGHWFRNKRSDSTIVSGGRISLNISNGTIECYGGCLELEHRGQGSISAMRVVYPSGRSPDTNNAEVLLPVDPIDQEQIERKREKRERKLMYEANKQMQRAAMSRHRR